MLFKSSVYTQASGSIGGITYSRNAGGMYTRGRAIPTNPNTAAQQAVKGYMSLLSQAWSNVLTSLQRGAWEAYAANVPLRNSLGDERPVSGLNQYIRSNVPRLTAGLSRIDAGPTNYTLCGLTPPTIVSITASSSLASIAFTNTDEWALATGGALLIFVSEPLQATINFFKGPFRYAGRVNGAGTAPTSPASVTIPFPTAVGKKLFVRFAATAPDGRLSADLIRFQLAV